MLVEGEGLAPGEQVGGEGDDFEPELVVRVAVEGQVAQAGVFQGADAILAAGPQPVPYLKCRGIAMSRFSRRALRLFGHRFDMPLESDQIPKNPRK